MNVDIFQAIEKNPLFSGLNDELIREIATSTSRKTLGTNETLFRKGDRAHAIWGVLSGRIVTQVWADDGKELLLDAFEAGDIFYTIYIEVYLE